MTSPDHPFARHHRLVPYFFFGVFLLVLWELLKVMSPFYISVLGSALVALMVHPLHERVRARVKRRALAAAATTTLAVLLVVAPCLLFGWAFLKDAERLYPTAGAWLEELRRWEAGEVRLPGGELIRALSETWHLDLEDIALKNLAELRGDVAQLAASAIANTFFVLVNVTLLAFMLFFFLRDGETMLGRVVELVPMAPSHKEAILSRLRVTLVGLVRGVFGLAIAQGV
ncbi:MAG: AI-2E family transporter, partial [Elusimicrobia bacterium]|nr:AI-2E family transporter [Elusimicrobiota bacterium]